MRATLISSLVAALLFPSLALAFPFGGRASQVSICYNNAIIAYVGPPRGGVFIGTPATRYYKFGMPTHAGQWLLGVAGAPYYCIITVVPIDVRAGINIEMMGSSQQ